MNNTLLMAHQVAGYPDDKTALAVSSALIQGGADILEIQLAFSDPSADGPAIQTACSTVLEHGYTVQDGFNFIAEVHRQHPDTTLFVMTYASLAVAPGISQFVQTAKAAGVSGLIIPDLPFDSDEGLGTACRTYGVQMIPVAAPSMAPQRLSRLTACGFEYIYVALRAGITGSNTVITPEMIAFIDRAASGGAKILGGFGITSAEQIAAIAPHVHAAVAGSVFVRIISEQYDAAHPEETAAALCKHIEEKAAELGGGRATAAPRP